MLIDCRPRWRHALAAPPFQLRRFYESGGVIRSSLPEQLAGRVSGTDVLVVDDGVATGQTLRALIEQLRSWQARRVVVVALIARMSIDDVLWFEGIRDLYGGTDAPGVHIRFLLPIQVPVPFFRSGECPLDTAASGIRPFLAMGRDAAAVARNILDDLHPRMPATMVLPQEERTLAARALRLRGAIELAIYEGGGSKYLKEALDMRDVGGLAALVSVLAVEPRLLLRPRLRGWLAENGRKAALSLLRDPAVSREHRIHSLTLLRTAFPEQFAEALNTLIAAPHFDAAVVERCAFQVFTLAAGGAVSEQMVTAADRLRLRLREHIRNADTLESGDMERVRRAHHLLQQLLWSNAPTHGLTPPTSLADSLVQLLTVLADEDSLHDLSGFLLALALLPQAKAMSVGKVKWYATQWEPWPERVVKEVVPLLRAVSIFLRDFLGPAKDVDATTSPIVAGAERHIDPSLRYLLTTHDITGDIDAIGLALDAGSIADRGNSVPLAIRMAAAAAEQLHSNVFGKDSAVRQLAKALVAWTLQDLVKGAESLFTRLVPEAEVSFVIDRPSLRATDATKPMLVTPSLWLSALAAVATNISTHASHVGGRIGVSVTGSSDGVLFLFADDGASSSVARPRSDHTQRLNERLETLGAWIDTTYPSDAAIAVGDVHIPVKQALFIAFSPEQLLDICARL